MRVLDVTRDPDVGGGQGLVVLGVASDADPTGCPDCGVVAVGHGRHVQVLHDAPCFGTRVRVRWRKRIWRCPEPSCRRGTWTEEHGFAPPQAKLTSPAVECAVSLLRLDDTTVSAIGRRPGVNWHTCWNAVKKHTETSIDIKTRAAGVKTIGMDEHIWRPSRISSTDKAVTVMVDLTRYDQGCLCARLLDAVQGRSGTVYADWLKEQGGEVTVSVEHAALDPFRGYRNAIRDELPEAVAVLDAFHVVKLAGNALDEVRRRVQQSTLDRRGHKDDPLYRIRRTLLTGVEHLTDRQRAQLDKWLPAGDPNSEVEVTWHVYQKVRHGFRNFTNYRIRILLAADGTRPYRRPPTKTRSAERADPG